MQKELTIYLGGNQADVLKTYPALKEEVLQVDHNIPVVTITSGLESLLQLLRSKTDSGTLSNAVILWLARSGDTIAPTIITTHREENVQFSGNDIGSYLATKVFPLLSTN